MSFDMPSTRTVNIKGAKEVRIRTTGNEKANFTVILSITSDGKKLPPMVFLKENNSQRKISRKNFYRS
jgi:hypothetical protein